MFYDRIKTIEEAFEYFTDCSLATVSYMAGLKSRNKSEYNRQTEIAQKQIDWIKTLGLRVEKGSRAHIIINEFAGSVSSWAKKYE